MKVVLTILFTVTYFTLSGQGDTFNYFYRVYFSDKGTYSVSDFNPADLLSERAIARRLKAGIEVPDQKDLPVFHNYISQVSSLGFKLHCTSRWMNTALFKTSAPADTSLLAGLPFVDDIKIVKMPLTKGPQDDKLDFNTGEISASPPYDLPVSMLNGHPLHSSGFNGKGVLIAILDGGFINADQVSSLRDLRTRRGIVATYDFISNDAYVYNYHSHGTAVLSVLAGNINGYILGTAPGASYILLRTEDGDTEFTVEEDFWAAGAEYADSAGADIISSSLGYSEFDDATSSYKYSDLDGKTTFVTRAAEIAASKGILVVNSAGNERNKEWVRIIAPSDGANVLAAGAVDAYENISVFSSAGPSYDGRVKPDNAALGVNVIVQVSLSGLATASGTSFSCPLLSGMSACLMQAVKEATNTDIIQAINASGDKYNSPDSLYGYGIPDMTMALSLLQEKHLDIPEKNSSVRPNPTNGELEIIFRELPETVIIEIFNQSGTGIYRKTFSQYAGKSLRISELSGREQGLYFIRLTTGSGIFTHKIIRIDR